MRHHRQISTQTFKIITQYGDMLVVKQGGQQAAHQQPAGQQAGDQQQSNSRPIIMTFHDLGLNSELQFANFCECEEVKLMLQTFTMLHVNFIGQEFDANGQPASSLPADFKYPNVDQLAECIVDVCAQLRVRSFIGLAVGVGAYVLSSLALLRPDLVQGLVLINPAISSCSITEWLCFKMSAIASNHPLHSATHHQSNQQAGGGHSGSSSPDLRHRQQQHHNQPHHHHHSSGLRKLWNAVHHHHQPTHSANSSQSSPTASVRHEAAHSETGQDSVSMAGGDGEGVETSAPAAAATAATSAKAATGHRLRQLILTRNFRLGKHQPEPQVVDAESPDGHDDQHEPPAANNCELTKRAAQHHRRRQSATSAVEMQLELDGPSAALQRHQNQRKQREPGDSRRFSGGAVSLDNSSCQAPSSPTGRSTKRPPIEYLMYHHFGSASFQRLRRPSAGSNESGGGGGGGGAAAEGRPNEAGEPAESVRQHRLSCGSSGSGQSQLVAAVAANLAQRAHRNSRDSTTEEEQEASAGRKSEEGSPARWRHASSRSFRAMRAHRMCVTSQYLASLSSDRERVAYMQMVYKHHFTQINSHNLWLLAQSFVKRHSLNLRKDCGAAAHAAAAAAALSTSIYTAFVGMAPAQPAESTGAAGSKAAATAPPGNSANTASDGAGEKGAPANHKQQSRQHCARQASDGSVHGSKQHQAVVAGTKVKRTFTCQTLILCSSVQMHCERALKLMSLLNPLQATWIKTDQLLVLEEKPKKVCQALRLFLQGIGYSMSTYERRLRIDSAQASFSSVDSASSARSLSDTPGSLLPAAASGLPPGQSGARSTPIKSKMATEADAQPTETETDTMTATTTTTTT